MGGLSVVRLGDKVSLCIVSAKSERSNGSERAVERRVVSSSG